MDIALYRGSLKSCNYRCSYCPFSKHGAARNELAKDREQWFSFVDQYIERAQELEICGVMVTPYGEALVHPWYWEGLARISALSWTQAAGAQTNLSFSLEKSLELFVKNNGKINKLRLWATFHPEMTTVTEFANTCSQLMQAGVTLCAGAVGVPKHAGLLRQLRMALPKDIYLWVNRMDGLGRVYTKEEIRLFCEIDPYFYRELQPHPADAAQCRGRLFAEGDGRVRLCNLSPAKKAEPFSPKALPLPCRRKRCSCYLAYGGRSRLVNQMLFGSFPLFRIPRRPKAVFLDIEGTLLPSYGRNGLTAKQREVSGEVKKALEVLAEREGTLLFFATTLPYADAKKRCGTIWHLFSGGVFAAGAQVLFCGGQGLQRREFFHSLDEEKEMAGHFKPLLHKYHARMLVYRENGGRCYKITLLKARHMPWSAQEAAQAAGLLPDRLRNRVRFLVEGHCMQVVAAEAGKAAGARRICGWLGIGVHEIFAAGDAKEDEELIGLMGRK
ncbi:MAG: STM4011 family radical SAM protein [Eubacterium sp.]|nr:STM4011 family radical SAM protein [Eubacterium sp.]